MRGESILPRWIPDEERKTELAGKYFPVMASGKGFFAQHLLPYIEPLWMITDKVRTPTGPPQSSTLSLNLTLTLDQHDVIEKHTQWGLELVERYVKFVKERTDIEQNYAKQLRQDVCVCVCVCVNVSVCVCCIYTVPRTTSCSVENIKEHPQCGLEPAVQEACLLTNLFSSGRVLCKKYSRRGSKEDQETKFTSQQGFQEVVNELNDYAAHREQLADNMSLSICVELTKYLHDIKQERKSLLADVKKVQQNLENSYKQLEMTKKRFEKEWKEAEKANQQAERVDQDPSSTKVDVDKNEENNKLKVKGSKAKLNAHLRTHTADECKNEYAAQLQKYNKEQNQYYRKEIPTIFNKLQEVDEKRIRKLAEGYGLFADTERKILPFITICLDKVTMASSNTKEKQDSLTLIEQHKSGLAPPADVEFEDYSQGIKPASVESPYNNSKGRIKYLFKKNKPPPVEDFSHLPSDQRRKRLQEKIEEVRKDLQKEVDKSEGLRRMKDVYEKNSQLGDPTSLDPQINQISHNISKLKGELQRYETWLGEAGGAATHTNNQASLYLTVIESRPSPTEPDDNLYECEFDEDFDDDEDNVPIAQCLALYDFDGASDGAVAMRVGEKLSMIKQDQGDGWVCVRTATGTEGYVPASYIKII
ncbi:hypothetical protein NFI96_029503 [Prochilodus magdalenae]|nr:hypothetical protein NFI96_029503 [Prochilodus magdalenae]